MTGFYIVLGLIIVAAIAIVFLSHHPFFKMTSSTTGQVIRAEHREIRDESERRDETVVTCRYIVHGRPYEVERVMRGRLIDRLPPGAKIRVKYNPAEPEMADLAL
jgi:hypothetical protein